MKATITKGKAHFEQFSADGTEPIERLRKTRVVKLLEALAPHVGELKVEIPDGATQSVQLSAIIAIVKSCQVTLTNEPSGEIGYPKGGSITYDSPSETPKHTAGETHWGEKIVTRSTPVADEAFLRTHAPSSYSNNQGTL